MKRIISLLLAVIALFTLVACGKPKDEVVFFNWGETIDTEVLKKFEEETGIRVRYSEFDENEKMYTLVKNNPSDYDLIVPSEYMVEKMASEGLLAELDHSLIPNIKEIDSVFLNKEYDPGNKYSIPMFYGTLGILYNKNKVEPQEMKDWDVLFNEKYADHIYMLNSSRDTMAVGLWHLGYSANTTNKDELNQAKELMQKQKSLVSAYLTDEIKQHMVNDNGVAALVYSGEAKEAVEENSDLDYYIPAKSNVWIDGFAIPKEAKNKENAHKLIDFLSRPENAALSGAIQASVVKDAIKFEPASELKDNEILYAPHDILETLEVYKNLGDFTSDLEKAWEEVKEY